MDGDVVWTQKDLVGIGCSIDGFDVERKKGDRRYLWILLMSTSDKPFLYFLLILKGLIWYAIGGICLWAK